MKLTKLRLLTLFLLALPFFAAVTVQAAYGDLYQLDFYGTITKYTPTGTPSTFASGFKYTYAIAFNGAGDLFVNDGDTIQKITPAGIKTTFATGLSVTGLACDSAGNLFVSDFKSLSILKFTPAGVKSTFASGLRPVGLVFGGGFGAPYLFAVDDGSAVNGQGKVYRFAADGTRTTSISGLNTPEQVGFDGYYLYVGTGAGDVLRYDLYFGFGGQDHSFATGLGTIFGMACDRAGNVFVSDHNSITKITPAKMKSTFASTNHDVVGLAFEPPRDLALNISTRLGVQTGENALIAGFIVKGPDHKQVLVRGLGPSLTKAEVANALQNPTIEMHFASGGVATNDNWKDGPTASTIAGGPFAPSDDREALLQFDLPPGSYTVIERGVGDTTGVGIVEVYDIGRSQNSSLANISTRGFVGTGDSVMIGGFITGSVNGAARVVVRALGPSLAAFGINNPLADPVVELRDKNGAVAAANDNWAAGADDFEIELLHLNPSDNNEAALVAVLAPGAYTAIVSGKNGGTGVGLVEVYNIQ